MQDKENFALWLDGLIQALQEERLREDDGSTINTAKSAGVEVLIGGEKATEILIRRELYSEYIFLLLVLPTICLNSARAVAKRAQAEILIMCVNLRCTR